MLRKRNNRNDFNMILHSQAQILLVYYNDYTQQINFIYDAPTWIRQPNGNISYWQQKMKECQVHKDKIQNDSCN